MGQNGSHLDILGDAASCRDRSRPRVRRHPFAGSPTEGARRATGRWGPSAPCPPSAVLPRRRRASERCGSPRRRGRCRRCGELGAPRFGAPRRRQRWRRRARSERRQQTEAGDDVRRQLEGLRALRESSQSMRSWGHRSSRAPRKTSYASEKSSRRASCSDSVRVSRTQSRSWLMSKKSRRAGLSAQRTTRSSCKLYIALNGSSSSPRSTT